MTIGGLASGIVDVAGVDVANTGIDGDLPSHPQRLRRRLDRAGRGLSTPHRYGHFGLVRMQDLETLRSSNDQLLQWKIDLEHCYLIGRNKDKPDRPEFKADPEWQHKQIGALSGVEITKKYPLLSEVVVQAKGWIEN
jgi:hypothetical protein